MEPLDNHQRSVLVGNKVIIGSGRDLTLISGPCVIESRDHALRCAEALVKITSAHKVQFIFKASYDKANRSSYRSFRGPGIEEGLKILNEIKQTFDLPVVSDVHDIHEIGQAAEVLDILQIPAFLSRQTDLLVAAAKTDLPIHIKKGQFMAPWDMKQVVEKIRSEGNNKSIVCDRGTMFGYSNLVVDMRSFQIMKEIGVPVSFDASHSVQLPGSLGTETGGQREFIPLLCRAAIASGIDLLFLETHPNVESAMSDRTNVFPLGSLSELLSEIIPIHELVHKGRYVSDYKELVK